MENKSSVHMKQLSMHDFVACGPLQAVETEPPPLHEKGHTEKSQVDSETFMSHTTQEFNLLSDLENAVNLSDHTLSDAEKSVLRNGLKFCPTPGQPHIGETRCDLDRFHCSLRLKCDFGKDQTPSTRDTSIGPFNNTRDLKLKSKSNWIPP